MRLSEKEENAIKARLGKRREKLNKNFKWTPENTQKIIDLNNALFGLYRAAYDEIVRLDAEYKKRYADGDNNYKDYTIEPEMWHTAPDGLSEEEEKLWNEMEENTIFWGPAFFVRGENGTSEIEPFEKQMLIDDQSWNEYPFNTKALDGTYIHYFMHDIFNHNDTYSLEDAIKMKLEDFVWQIKVCHEHWAQGGWSEHACR